MHGLLLEDRDERVLFENRDVRVITTGEREMGYN